MSMARNVEWKIICFIRGSVSFYSIQYVHMYYVVTLRVWYHHRQNIGIYLMRYRTVNTVPCTVDFFRIASSLQSELTLLAFFGEQSDLKPVFLH